MGGERHERKMAKKHKKPEMARIQRSNTEKQKTTNNPTGTRLPHKINIRSPKLPTKQKLCRAQLPRAKTVNRHIPRKQLHHDCGGNRRLQQRNPQNPRKEPKNHPLGEIERSQTL